MTLDSYLLEICQHYNSRIVNYDCRLLFIRLSNEKVREHNYQNSPFPSNYAYSDGLSAIKTPGAPVLKGVIVVPDRS